MSANSLIPQTGCFGTSHALRWEWHLIANSVFETFCGDAVVSRSTHIWVSCWIHVQTVQKLAEMADWSGARTHMNCKYLTWMHTWLCFGRSNSLEELGDASEWNWKVIWGSGPKLIEYLIHSSNSFDQNPDAKAQVIPTYQLFPPQGNPQVSPT